MFADRKAAHAGTVVERLTGDGGASRLGMTTASELDGLNVRRACRCCVRRAQLDRSADYLIKNGSPRLRN